MLGVVHGILGVRARSGVGRGTDSQHSLGHGLTMPGPDEEVVNADEEVVDADEDVVSADEDVVDAVACADPARFTATRARPEACHAARRARPDTPGLEPGLQRRPASAAPARPRWIAGSSPATTTATRRGASVAATRPAESDTSESSPAMTDDWALLEQFPVRWNRPRPAKAALTESKTALLRWCRAALFGRRSPRGNRVRSDAALGMHTAGRAVGVKCREAGARGPRCTP